MTTQRDHTRWIVGRQAAANQSRFGSAHPGEMVTKSSISRLVAQLERHGSVRVAPPLVADDVIGGRYPTKPDSAG